MYGLLLDKVLHIFLHNPAYEHDGFRTWCRIHQNYDPRVKDALFESVSTLYTLEKGPDESIGDYMSCAQRLLSGIHGINFNTMSTLFVIVNFDHSHFGALFYPF